MLKIVNDHKICVLIKRIRELKIFNTFSIPLIVQLSLKRRGKNCLTFEEISGK